jgi:hypothetical protein
VKVSVTKYRGQVSEAVGVRVRTESELRDGEMVGDEIGNPESEGIKVGEIVDGEILVGETEPKEVGPKFVDPEDIGPRDDMGNETDDKDMELGDMDEKLNDGEGSDADVRELEVVGREP